jgi:hypothetical protein
MAPLNDGQTGMTGTPSERFDDDRLLAYALQIDDDAELEQALATDAALRERLLAIRGDLGLVEDQLRAAVPAAAESWADLSAARWGDLRPYVSTRPAPAVHRRRFSLRVLAPAVGVVAAAALAVGLVLSQTGGVGTLSSGSSSGQSEAVGSTGKAVPQAVPGGSSTYSVPAADAAAYQTAVVARAGAVNDGVQDFTVLRTLKGAAGHSVRLSVEVGGALKQGALALLLLTPTNTLATPGATAAPTPSGPTPSASVTDGTRAAPHLYLYKGTTAVAQELPAGTDPGTFTLP